MSSPERAARALPVPLDTPSRGLRDFERPGMVSGQPGETLMLLPGQLHFGWQVAALRTLLGSCVAITLWHPRHRLGGMCHYLLPSRRRPPDTPREGRFGDEAVAMLVDALLRAGTKPTEYEAYLCGGADTLPDNLGTRFAIGERNAELGRQLIAHHGFQLKGVDVGGSAPRTVTLQLATGELHVKRGQTSA